MTALPAEAVVADKKPETQRIRLDFLDGLRGLAALYVVFSHTAHEMRWQGNQRFLSAPLQAVFHLFSYGRFAVAIFIVLSGYCLMLPVARSEDGRLRGGVWDYLKRRARRILPPYYAALVFALLLIALVPGMQQKTTMYTQDALPAFQPDVLLSHLFLVHNLRWDWIYRIDSPMWSVATEWQIYFVFPALLLPAWRRLGVASALVMGAILGFAPHFLLHARLDLAVPYYITLFALGMAGASLGFSRKPADVAWRERVPWGALAVVCSLLVLAYVFHLRREEDIKYGIVEPFVGLAAVSLIIYCARYLTQGRPGRYPLLLRLLESRGAVALGAFSYSLYLVHYPVLACLHTMLNAHNVAQNAEFLTLILVGVPLALLVAYLFHLAFERRFMSAPARTKQPITQSA